MIRVEKQETFIVGTATDLTIALDRSQALEVVRKLCVALDTPVPMPEASERALLPFEDHVYVLYSVALYDKHVKGLFWKQEEAEKAAEDCYKNNTGRHKRSLPLDWHRMDTMGDVWREVSAENLDSYMEIRKTAVK